MAVGREGVEGLLEGRVPPPTLAYLGCVAGPVPDGWEAHRQAFDALRPHREAIPASSRERLAAESNT